jgi:hypothetical protein
MLNWRWFIFLIALIGILLLSFENKLASNTVANSIVVGIAALRTRNHR